jgi:hypothetical protein
MSQTSRDRRRTPLVRRNYLLGVINSVATQLGMNATSPSLVLSVFVRVLGGSNALVGLLPAIRYTGWMLPQYLLAGWLKARQRKVPLVTRLELTRALAYGLIAASTLALGRSNPAVLLVVFVALFTLSRLVASVSGLARWDVVGKTIPREKRASFFATRSFWGGALVLGAGFLVQYLLDPKLGQPFPVNFALLFALSGFAFVVSALAFSGVRERPKSASRGAPSIRAQLALAPALLKRTPKFRRFLLVRILLIMTRLVDPFYPVFALEVLGAPASMVGFYLSAMMLARILANLLWQRIERARGPYFLVSASSFLTVLTPLLAVALPWLMRLASFTVKSHGLLPAYLFTGVFLLAGGSQSGRGIGLSTVLLDIAPAEERVSHIGLINTVLGLVSLLPIVSGAIIDRLGFEPVFAAATGILLAGFLATLGLRTPERTRGHRLDDRTPAG